MARKRKLEIIIEGVNKGLKQSLSSAASDVEGFENKIHRVGAAMGKLAKYGALAAGAALTGVGVAAKYAFSQYAELERVSAQTNAVLQSTGGVAGVTASHVTELATELQNISGVSDEVIASGQNLLLTFTNIRNEAGEGRDIFDQATRAALDMSIALGEDMTSSAMRIGKALNDPIQGVTALRRVGVQLSEEQENQVKQFMAVNDVASAQAVILQELQKEFGGSAEAAGQTLGGQLELLKNRFADLAQSATGRAAPGIQQAITTISDALLQVDITPIGEAFASIGDIAASLTPVFLDMFTSMAEVVNSLAPIISQIAESFGPVIGDVLGRIADLTGRILDQVASSGIIDDLAQIASILADSILDVLEDILPVVVPVVDAFVSLAKPLLDIADKAGILEGLIYAWASGKVLGAISSLAGSFGSIAGSIGGIGAAAGAATGSVGGLSAALESLNTTAIGLGAVATGLYAIGNAAYQWYQASEEAMDSQLRYINTVKGAWGELTEEAVNQIAAWAEAMGIAGNNTAEKMDNVFQQIISSGVQMGANLKTVPPIITQAFDSEIPALAEKGWEGMRVYLARMLEATGQIAPDKISAVNAQILADLKSGDPAKQQAAIESIRGYLQSMVDNGSMTAAQRDVILSSIKQSLDISGSLYEWGKLMGMEYLNGLAAAVGGTVVPGVGVTVPSPSRSGGRVILHEGGVVGDWIRAHSGLLAYDEVPAILLAGEGVVNRRGMQVLGEEGLERLNRGQPVPGVSVAGNLVMSFPSVKTEFDARGVVSQISSELAREVKNYQGVHGL